MWTSNGATQTIPYEFSDTTPHLVPACVGRYVIYEVRGAGAMGVVYRGYDPELDRAVAIKLVRAGARSSPSWSPSGELFVRALETGVVSRVALETGALTPVARLPEMPRDRPFDSRLMFPTDGDILAVEVELSLNLWETIPDEQLESPFPVESSVNLVR